MATMPDDLALELTQVRLAGAQAALAAARAQLETLRDDSDEALQAACELIPLRRAVKSAQVEVELARGPACT
jgi:hypothetical protein